MSVQSLFFSGFSQTKLWGWLALALISGAALLAWHARRPGRFGAIRTAGAWTVAASLVASLALFTAACCGTGGGAAALAAASRLAGRQKRACAEGEVCGVVASLRRPYPGALKVVVEGEYASSIPGRFLLVLPDEPWQDTALLHPGGSLCANVRLQPLAGFDQRPVPANSRLFPPLMSYDAYLFRRGIIGSGRAQLTALRLDNEAPHRRTAFIAHILTRFGDTNSLRVIIASTLGEKDLLSDELQQLFRSTGTTHLLVISGFHVSAVFFVIYRTVRFLFSRSQAAMLLVPTAYPAGVLGLSAAIGFTWLSGADLPSVRAALVIAVFACGEVLSRRSAPMRSFLLCFTLSQLVWPGSCFEPGCQLTFLAVYGLLAGNRWFAVPAGQTEKLIPSFYGRSRAAGPQAYGRRFLQSAGHSALCCLFAWAFTLPAQVFWFEAFSPAAPLYNVLFIPFFSSIFIVLGGAAAAGVFMGIPGSGLLMQTAVRFGQYYLQIMKAVHNMVSGSLCGLIAIPQPLCSSLSLALCGLVVVMAFVSFFHEELFTPLSRNRK